LLLAGSIIAISVAQSAATLAAGPDTISRLSCPDVSQSAVARQAWSGAGAPYGVPLAQWRHQEFGALRGRIAECARQSGADAQSALAYVHRLEDKIQLQNDRSQSAANAEAAGREAESAMLRKVQAFTSSDELNAFCSESRTTRGITELARARISMACKEKATQLGWAERDRAEARKREESQRRLPDLLKRLKEMPPTLETLVALQELRSNNRYRLPELSFSDQNGYYNAIGERLGEIRSGLTDQACATIVSKLSVPAEIRDARVIDGLLGGQTLTYFLCGPGLTTKNVSVALKKSDAVEIAVDDVVLTFARRRYLVDRNIEVSIDSPIQGGVNALVLTGASQNGRMLAIGNPNFFVVNFYSQFTPQVSEFVAQWMRSELSSKPAQKPEEPSKGSEKAQAAVPDYLRLSCQMGRCLWSAVDEKFVVKEAANGRLVHASMSECETSHDSSEKYGCKGSEVTHVEYVAFCSIKFPSVALKNGQGKWFRTKLSISEDGVYGYNVASVRQYLRICHDYAGGNESFDVIGARFGYGSRYATLGDDAQDTLDSIANRIE
jgi:hypothetical protein